MRAIPAWGKTAFLAVLVIGLAVPPRSAGVRAQEPPAQKQDEKKPADQQPAAQKPPEYSITVETPLVNVDAVVTDQDGNILSGLKRQNFRIYEDGAPQSIANFAPTEAPITIVMLLEFSKMGYEVFGYTAKEWSFDFTNHLGKDDWVALMTFSLKTKVEVDFTKDKREIQAGIARLYFPDFREANLFDSLLDTLDRLQDVKGKKSILLLASGQDTFSKHTLDQTLKRLKETDVTIFCVGVASQLLEHLEEHNAISSSHRMDYLQAQNQLTTIARMTGGYAWFPMFEGAIPDIFNSVSAFLRNQYTIGYMPTNQAKDGKFRKIRVEVVDDSGQPMVFTNQKGKKRKIIVYAREGYVAAKANVGD